MAQRLDESPRADRPTYGGSFSNQRFSMLRQVSTKNVARHKVMWTFAVPDAGAVDNSLQTTPLVVRGKDAGVPAFDAVVLITSAELFRHETRGGVNAGPITFLANGKQLVTVAAGGHLHYGNRLDNLIVTLGLD
jgi:glucose dehydrogenase